ncbi:protein PAT1 homolog 1-like [Topomyia yanbarensis]|uniref:protein PAT1 homolog 1-like n=1 Tax=Topomyia yanbarensis TaxID=2498891 RepID=UPI00273B7599|nr:protein PAT1 homolog 1-like [Topomyia yanbarensis]
MDSFFGFDTSSPGAEDEEISPKKWTDSRSRNSEEEYDALNDETFGNPDKSDWENIHESLVRLERGNVLHSNKVSNGKDVFIDDDLDIHLSRFDSGDGEDSTSSTADLSFDDDLRNKLRLDSSIWDAPVKQINYDLQNTFPNLLRNSLYETPASKSELPVSQGPIEMISVEDIERKIIQKQLEERLKKERRQQKLQLNQKNKKIEKLVPVPSLMNLPLQPMVPPVQLLAVRNQMFPPPPLLNHQSRIPIGFLPYNFLPPHYTTPINNIALHPGFPTNHQFGLFSQQPTQLPAQLPLIHNIQNNQFNKRLVEEIQQNHPMLMFNRQNPQYNNQKHHNMSKGHDRYANFMSNREKQWLIGIQLTQLNSGAPYINDYYFTVYKDRLALLKGDKESKAHKDNQLNHPFTQPKGHAQLLLMSSLARNCATLNSKGGQRERKGSESKYNNDQKEQQQGRTYAPLQFENSLGKLQCGSVTAPRKIIDMDVVGNEITNEGNARLELSMQRKSRHVLLHIETLFQVVLRMEDLRNPIAIEAVLLAKEKCDVSASVELTNSSFSSNTKPETFDELLIVLITGLTQDKLLPMLGVRKGKILLRRIFALLREHSCRWDLWSTTFSSIPLLAKKDRDDQEGILFALYTEFERHVQYSQFKDLLKISQVIATDKILSHLASCKFLLSSVITIIFKMESFFDMKPCGIENNQQVQWIQCLELITATAVKLLNTSAPIQNPQHSIKIDRENIIIRTMRSHFERFPQRVKGNDFLGFITADPLVAGSGGKAT